MAILFLSFLAEISNFVGKYKIRETSSLAPCFVQKPTEIVEGDSLVVVCEVVGDPQPEVKNQ